MARRGPLFLLAGAGKPQHFLDRGFGLGGNLACGRAKQ